MDKEDKKLYSMFYPRSKHGILQDFPEFRNIDEMKAIRTTNEYLFVWYFACKASPLSDWAETPEKINKAIELSFGRKGFEEMYGDQYARFMAGNFPNIVSNAIEVIKTFKPGPRIRSMMMVEKIMGNFETLIDINPKTEFADEEGNTDWTKKKAYIDAASKVATTLPGLIEHAEGRFGMDVKGGEDEDVYSASGGSSLDDFHSEENN